MCVSSVFHSQICTSTHDHVKSTGSFKTESVSCLPKASFFSWGDRDISGAGCRGYYTSRTHHCTGILQLQSQICCIRYGNTLSDEVAHVHLSIETT